MGSSEVRIALGDKLDEAGEDEREFPVEHSKRAKEETLCSISARRCRTTDCRLRLTTEGLTGTLVEGSLISRGVTTGFVVMGPLDEGSAGE